MSKLPERPDYELAPSLKQKKRKTKPATLSLDMPSDQLKGVAAKESVKITITGTVEALTLVERKGDEEDYYDGSRITIYDPDIVLAESGDIGELADED